MNMKHYIVENKRLAVALEFLGFKCYRFTGNKGYTVFGFEDTEIFRQKMNELFEIRLIKNNK